MRVVGRVSMDLIVIDAATLPPEAAPGAWVELIGPICRSTMSPSAPAPSATDYSGLGSRYARHYVTDAG